MSDQLNEWANLDDWDNSAITLTGEQKKLVLAALYSASLKLSGTGHRFAVEFIDPALAMLEQGRQQGNFK